MMTPPSYGSLNFYIHFKRELNPLFVASKTSNFSDYLGNNQITHIRISQRQLGITRPSFSHLQLVNFLASFKVCKGGVGRNYMHIRKTELRKEISLSSRHTVFTVIIN